MNRASLKVPGTTDQVRRTYKLSYGYIISTLFSTIRMYTYVSESMAWGFMYEHSEVP